MDHLAEILLWGAVLGLVHSYLFYPLILSLLARGKKSNAILYDKTEDLPQVSVVMSVYNEERVIRQKLDSLIAVNYPRDRWRILIGSDCSSDQTNAIITEYAKSYPELHFFPYTERQGKPIVVNKLVESAASLVPLSADHLFLFTDASVILAEDTVWQLVRHFKNPEIFLVDANMQTMGVQQKGISRSEHQYLSGEVRLKQMESLVWGKMIGPFGGCYAMRSNYYEPVPPGYLVDDFYITMRAYEKGGMAINELKALCYEGLSHDIKEEYRRKSRISAGNFKNLATFKHLLWPPYRPLAFGFLSHKVLRWFGPFFIIFVLVSCSYLAWSGNNFYRGLLFLLGLWFIGAPILDGLLQRLKINWLPLRSITYFNNMNLALLEGFFKYLKGVKSNVWQPPRRDG